MPSDDAIQDYRRSLGANAPLFVLPRRFVADESWTKAATSGGGRYLGLLREYEPDLSGILVHKHLVILGEPGAGKSTTAQAIIHHVLSEGTATPVFASLKSYEGRLRALLLGTTPAAVLDMPLLARTYVLDGIDEVSATHREALRKELNALLTEDLSASVVLTARQAFHAHNRGAFPDGFTVYHLLDFDDRDVRACARHHGVDPDAFLVAVRQAECKEEISNPLVLNAMLRRFKAEGSLSPLRYDNIGYVVEELIRSRPQINAMRQRRALRMLAITCETAARNELTDEEALRVLHEAIEIPTAAAEQLLGELSHSILIRTPVRISFQMRSYGEYLAAEELHDKPIERVKELAFVNNEPVDTWLNAITYLAEMNAKVRTYFAIHHPAWLVNISPAALSEPERTTLARHLLHGVNQRQAYIVDERTSPLRRLAHILTPDVHEEIVAQLTSNKPHEEANALVLLSILRNQEIVPQALRRATENRNASSLRYSAIVALINTGNNGVVNDLLNFAQVGDAYHIQIVDSIGSLCAPEDFPRVLPLLNNTNAGLSSAFYHFRELTTKQALTSAIAYLTDHPETLNGFGLDTYLEPLIDLIPEYWGNDIATSLGQLLASLERIHFYNGKIGNKIINYIRELDQDGTAIKTAITTLQQDGMRLWHINQAIRSLITVPVAEWTLANAPTYAIDIGLMLLPGPARDLLRPLSPQELVAQAQARAQYLAEQQQHEQEITTTRQQHQHTMRTARTMGAVLNASVRLQKEHWPAIAEEQRDWLAREMSTTLEQLDLANSIRWTSENQWTHPNWLNPLLDLTDYYNLQLANDTTIVLSLRSWPDQAISNYYRKHGLSGPAQDILANLLGTPEHESITRNVLSFLRETEFTNTRIQQLLTGLASDTQQPTTLRSDALERISTAPEATDTLLLLVKDPEPSIQSHAFRALIKRQHRATISQALATLSDDDLRSGEIPFPNSSPLDWIGSITTADVIGELRALRRRTLLLDLWRVAKIVTGTIAAIDKTRAVAVIREQLPQTPEGWRTHERQEADQLERAARIEAVQQIPFDGVIRKLKGATSMLRIKVWCEGATDQPVFRALFRELGEDDIADTLDFVGGWPNLIAKQEPERWLDGCRQAFVIMDGDQGRKLNKTKQPLTDQAKNLERRFKNHALTLHVLRRYGIENYLPRHACEAILGRDLTTYFPIPIDKKIQDHFIEPQPLWTKLLNRLRRRPTTSFYQKRLNEEAAAHLQMSDIEGTDLAEIINSIKEAAVKARQY